MRGVERKRGISMHEVFIMFFVLLLTIAILGVFYGYVYSGTPAYFNLWGVNFAFHEIVPYIGTAMLGFVMLVLGIKFKNN